MKTNISQANIFKNCIGLENQKIMNTAKSLIKDSYEILQFQLGFAADLGLNLRITPLREY